MFRRTAVVATALAIGFAGSGHATPAEPRAAAPQPGWLERATAGAERAGADPEVLALLDRARRADESFTDAVLVPWSDLDGDGLGDVVDFRVTVTFTDAGDIRVDLELDARRGTDGKRLFVIERELGNFGFVLDGKVGNPARNGVILVNVTGTGAGTDVSYTGATRLEATGYTGTGQAAWNYVVAGAGGDSAAGGQWVLPFVADAGNLVPGAAMDLLLEVDDITALPDGTLVNTAQPQLLDGANGVVKNSGQSVVSVHGFVYLRAVPDVSKDKLDDVVVTEPIESGTRLTARKSSDGTPVWTTSLDDVYDGYATDTGDVTGDGVDDLVVLSYDGDFGPSARAATFELYLLDGATGKLRWRRPGDDLWPLGNLDGKPGIELAVFTRNPTGSAGLRIEAVNHSKKVLWRTDRKVSTSGYRRWEGGVGMSLVGDVHGDGVTDMRFQIVVMPYGAKGKRDEGWIDGRTGRVHRDPVKELIGVDATVDGRGSDAAVMSFRRSVLTVTLRDGRTGAVLWTTAVGVSGEFAADARSARLNRDKCAEVIAEVAGLRSTAIVFDGASGSPLWSIARGDGDPKVSKPKTKSRTDRNACR